MTDLLFDVLAAVFVGVSCVFLTLAAAGMVSAARAFAKANRADAQPDYTPDPVDAADDTLPDWISRLRDDMTACEPDGLIDEIYAFLKGQAK